jgi:hypothetical protein
MPRGSRPGERRGGRKPGTPNKKTLIKNAVFLAAAAEPNGSPLEFMLALMRDPQVPFGMRLDMASIAAPYVHARPAPVRKRRPDPLDLRDRLGDGGDLKFGKLDAKPDAAKPTADRGRGPGGGSGREAGEGEGDGAVGGAEGGGLSPLDFLLAAMHDPEASPRQRVQAVRVAAQHTHAPAGATEAPSMIVVEDKFGFKVDPELARAERDDSLREDRLRATSHLRKKDSVEAKAADQELEQMGKRRAERLARFGFPDGYSYGDRQNDENRLAQLSSKRSSHKKLTPEEDAEEAHLAVRVLNPNAIEPEVRAAAIGPFEIEWPATRIAELDERVAGGETLTAAEEAERQDLRRRYPEAAAQADRLDHRYRYWLRKETESAEKADIESGKAYQTAKDKCEPLRDPTKIASADLPSALLKKIHRLESLRFDGLLTPEEAHLLEKLHRVYPRRAEKARKFVNRRLSYDKANREYTRRLGYARGPIKQGEWPRIWTLPADDARSRTPERHSLDDEEFRPA